MTGTQKQLQLTGANYKGDRRELDFYPTPSEVTKALMLFLSVELADLDCFIVWEPACGDGAMSQVIAPFVTAVISTDIRKSGYGESDIDFLQTSCTDLLETVDCIITNPPFKDAEVFIKKAVAEVPIVAMLLKSQYWHAKSRFALFRDTPPAYILPLTWRPDFLGGDKGGKPTIECAWSVWIKGDTLTKYKPLEKPM